MSMKNTHFGNATSGVKKASKPAGKVMGGASAKSSKMPPAPPPMGGSAGAITPPMGMQPGSPNMGDTDEME